MALPVINNKKSFIDGSSNLFEGDYHLWGFEYCLMFDINELDRIIFTFILCCIYGIALFTIFIINIVSNP